MDTYMHTYVHTHNASFFLCVRGVFLAHTDAANHARAVRRPFHPCQTRPCHLHRLVDYNAIHKAETWNCQSLIGERPTSILPSNRPRWLDGPSARVVVPRTRCAPPRQSGLAAKPVAHEGNTTSRQENQPGSNQSIPCGTAIFAFAGKGAVHTLTGIQYV